jgi:hypothetical protein
MIQMEQARDPGDQFARFDRFGEVHLVARQEGPLPILWPRVSGNRDGHEPIAAGLGF